MLAGLERVVMEGRTGDDETIWHLKQKNVFTAKRGSASTVIPERFYRVSSIFLCHGCIPDQKQCGNEEKEVTTILIVDSIVRPKFLDLLLVEWAK